MRRIGEVAAATVRGAAHQTALGIILLSIPSASYRFGLTVGDSPLVTRPPSFSASAAGRSTQ